MKKISMLLVALLVLSLAACGVAEAKPYAGQTLTISTFAFKKIVRNAQNLLNGVRIDPDIGY